MAGSEVEYSSRARATAGKSWDSCTEVRGAMPTMPTVDIAPSDLRNTQWWHYCLMAGQWPTLNASVCLNPVPSGQVSTPRKTLSQVLTSLGVSERLRTEWTRETEPPLWPLVTAPPHQGCSTLKRQRGEAGMVLFWPYL